VLTPAQLTTANLTTQPQIADNPAIRVSSGVGLTWGSPVGPVRLDVGVPIRRQSYDKTQFFRISFGTKF